MNLAALKPYIPHWTLYNKVGIYSTRTNPEGDSQRDGKVAGKLCQFGVSKQQQQKMQHFSPQKIRAHWRFPEFCVVFVGRGDLGFLAGLFS